MCDPIVCPHVRVYSFYAMHQDSPARQKELNDVEFEKLKVVVFFHGLRVWCFP